MPELSHVPGTTNVVFRNSNFEGFEGMTLLLSYDLRDEANRGEQYYNDASDFQ